VSDRAKDLSVTLTIGELQELVRDAVRAEVAKLPLAGTSEVLRLREAAQLVGRTPKNLMQLVRAGRVPARFISEREPRFMRSELLGWLASLPSQPTKKTGTEF
jgi:hypothetical protein